jgi:serine/alanine adding enzyme
MTLEIGQYAGSPTAWDDFVEKQSGWTHFHRYGWRRVIERVFGHECHYLAARDESGAIAGVLPLVHVGSAMFGRYLVSMPFVNYGGPLGNSTAVSDLVDHAVALAKAKSVRLLELRSREPLSISLPVSHRKITVVLDLPGDPGKLFASFDPNVRRRIRRSQKAGVEVRFGPEQVDSFYEVFSRHMRDLGTPTQSRRLFEAIAAEFSDAWFGCAYYREKPIACIAGLQWGSEFEVTWASALIAYKEIAANMQLYWAFMERAIDRQLNTFNFGRCTPNGGTHRFKSQWGSRDVPLWWYDFAERQGTTTPSPEAKSYSWGPRVWRRLPMTLATAWGPSIARYLP